MAGHCEKCKTPFKNGELAIEVKFVKLDPETLKSFPKADQYVAMHTEESWGPLCTKCAIKYINRESQ